MIDQSHAKTGYHDADGKEIIEGDILQSAHDPGRRGIVVRFGELYLIECGDEAHMLKYRLDAAQEWRIIGNIKDVRPA